MALKEDFLQYSLVQHLRKKNIFCFHVPNGGLRTRSEASRFVAIGVKAGVPDLVILGENKKCIFIELKVGRNKRSSTQEIIHSQLTKMGFPSYLIQVDSVDYGIQELDKIILENGLLSA